MVYSRALTAAEVRNLYSRGSAKVNASQNSLITNGLLGLWTFDSRDIASTIAYDRKGGHNGTISGSPQKKMGKVGQSLYFDGTDDWVNAGSAATLDNPSSLSISAWFKIPTGGGGRILSKSGGVDKGFLLDIMDFSYIRFTGQYNTTDLDVGYSVSLVADEWTHVLLTWDGSTSASNAILYLNGVAVNSFLSTQDGVGTREDDSGADLMIGARSDTGNPRFLGNMDEVRYYNRVLSAGEVKTLYNAGESKINVSQNSIGGSSLNSGLVGMWSFNSKDLSDRVYDRSGNGHDGYFIGGATSSAKTIGKVGQSINFDGVNDTVLISHSSLLDLDMTESATFSFWINKESASANAGSIYKRTSGSPGYSVDILTTGAVSFSIGDLFSNNNRIGNDTSTTMNLNQWYHVVVTYDGSINSSGIKVYFDGVIQPMTNAVDNWGGGSSSNGFDFSLGARESGTSRLLDGKMDEVRFYNRVLSDNEIKQLYLLGK
jgi:hypothetical protein